MSMPPYGTLCERPLPTGTGRLGAEHEREDKVVTL
jgi:hypothetical protein